MNTSFKIRVGVILDVVHKDPWIDIMNEALPVGHLVEIVGISYLGNFKAYSSMLESENYNPWYIHPDSIEIIGEL